MPNEMKIDRPLAPESPRVTKMRERISNHWSAQEPLKTTKTLEKMKEVIKARLHRTNADRETSIPDKPMILFAHGDGVKNVSDRRVLAIRRQLEQQYEEHAQASPPMTIKVSHED